MYQSSECPKAILQLSNSKGPMQKKATQFSCYEAKKHNSALLFAINGSQKLSEYQNGLLQTRWLAKVRMRPENCISLSSHLRLNECWPVNHTHWGTTAISLLKKQQQYNAPLSDSWRRKVKRIKCKEKEWHQNETFIYGSMKLVISHVIYEPKEKPSTHMQAKYARYSYWLRM